MASTALTHLEFLTSQIGPRGSTTASELRAAEYARDHFKSLGYETYWEPFRSPKTGWRQFMFASVISTAAVIIGLFGARPGAWMAFIVSLVTAVSVLLELYFRPNLLRWIVPKGSSQNVWAKAIPTGAATRRILVLGHVDTHRTPWVFETPSRLRFFRIMSTLGTASFALIGLLFLVIAVFDLPSIRWLSLLFLPVLIVGILMTGQADRTDFTEGANDNGSGASIVMSLADSLKDDPLSKIEVWFLVTGCEEVGSYGAQAFVAEHRDELEGLKAINLDNVAGKGAGVCFITLEGMLIPMRPSQELLDLAAGIQNENSGQNVYSKPFTTLHTDATCLMSHGIPSLSFVGLTPDNTLPNWHRRTDTLAEVDPGTVEAVDNFVLEMLRRLDSGPSAAG